MTVLDTPTWLANRSVAVIKTANGYAIGPQLDAKVTECVTFETFGALIYYLEQRFAGAP